MPELSFQGGINQLNDINVSKEECVSGFNFDLELGKSSLTSRRPNDLKVNATDRINGILQLVKRDDTFTTLLIAGTNVYNWDGSEVLSDSIGTVVTNGTFRDVIWPLDDHLIITDINLQNPVKQWDGTSFTTMVTGLPNELRAKYALVHNGRLWLANLESPAGTPIPHVIAVSRLEDHQDFDLTRQSKGQDDGQPIFDTVADPFFMVAPDLRAINGFDVINQEVVISTNNGRLYRILGSDPNDYEIRSFYQGSAAIGDESFANIGNDLVYVRNGGVIESLQATETSGDVTANDLSLTIRDIARGLNGAKVVYEQRRQKVFFFVAGQALVLFKEMISSNFSPWSIYRTALDNSFNATSAKYLRIPGASEYTVYWGDESGNVYDINGEGRGDAGSVDIDVRQKKSMFNNNYGQAFIGRVMYRRRQPVEVNISVEFGDEFTTSTASLMLRGNPPDVTKNYYNDERYYSNETYYSEGLILGAFPSTKGFSPIGRGVASFMEFQVNTSNDFQIDKFIFAENDSIQQEVLV